MRQDQLDGLATFVCVAQTRGFSSAAVRLGVSPSAVSQTIRQLETRVGLALFSRTTRSVSLTEAGLRFLERVAPAVEELAAASSELADRPERPAGLLRLTVPTIAYSMVLEPAMAPFLRAYPDVNVEMSIDSAMVDIVASGFDAGIRFDDKVPRDMVGLKIGPRLYASMVASPLYLAERGTPKHPRDLLVHDCITYRFTTSGQLERWDFEKNGERMKLAVSGRLVLNNAVAMTQAAINGIGIANLFTGSTDPFIHSGQLVRVLADWSPALPDMTLYYPDRRRVPAKLRAFIDFLRAPAQGVASRVEDRTTEPA
jgi:DNA-binding transcriptional LysR family regulator